MNFVEDVDNADAEILWSFTGNSDLVIHIDANRIASISVPSENWNGTEAVTFRATDVGNLFDEDGVIFSVSTDNTAPVADAGPDQTITEGNTVTLDASGSNDPDGNPISYQWTQTGGVGVTLSSPTAVQPTFVTPSVDGNGATLSFQLMVEDTSYFTDMDSMRITVDDNGITGFPDGAITFTSASGAPMGISTTRGNLTSLDTIDPAAIADTNNRPSDLIYGLLDMEISVSQSG